MNIENLTLQQHLEKFMPSLPKDFFDGQSSIKVFPLQTIKEYLKCPTPLFKPQYTIVIHITRGEVKAQVGMKTITAKKQSVLFMLSNRIISRKYISKDAEGFGIIIPEEVLLSLFGKTQFLKLFETSPFISLSNKSNEIIESLNRLLLQELSEKKPNPDFIRAALQATLFKILEQTHQSAAISKSEEIAFKCKQLMYAHFSHEHNVSFYARQLNISENYLSKCTKQVFQKTPKELWTDTIIQHSQILLQDRTKEISEIAYMLNFSDASYFGRLFKQVTGTTPTLFKKRASQDLSE